MIVNEVDFKKLTPNKKLLYPETYTVKFWAKVENRLEQDAVIYRGDKKGLRQISEKAPGFNRGMKALRKNILYL